MPLLKTQKRQFAAKWLALYTSRNLDKNGSVLYYAPILGVEVMQRQNINTPWNSNKDKDKLCVLYKLGTFIKLPKPIVNRTSDGKGQRFSSHRWTSRLALERAEIISELLIETEPEWRLYEDLRACGINFDLSPEKVVLQDPEVPFGRVWFTLENGIKIRYAGASGYVVKKMDRLEKYFMRLEDVIRIIKT